MPLRDSEGSRRPAARAEARVERPVCRVARERPSAGGLRLAVVKDTFAVPTARPRTGDDDRPVRLDPDRPGAPHVSEVRQHLAAGAEARVECPVCREAGERKAVDAAAAGRDDLPVRLDRNLHGVRTAGGTRRPVGLAARAEALIECPARRVARERPVGRVVAPGSRSGDDDRAVGLDRHRCGAARGAEARPHLAAAAEGRVELPARGVAGEGEVAAGISGDDDLPVRLDRDRSGAGEAARKA